MRPALADPIGELAPLRLTLLVLLLRPPADDALRAAVWLTSGAAVLIPAVLRAPPTWFVLASLTILRVIQEWPLADNHIYLLSYWCLAIALAQATPAPFDVLSRSARWLVGLAFLCAVIWKAALAPDFVDARFFRVTLLTDPRFVEVTRAVGGLSAAQMNDNQKALSPAPAGVEILDGPVLFEPPALRALAVGLTWGGLGVELLVAAAFLSRRPYWLHQSRHALLIAFCVLTYAVAPVGGFGWLLAALGLAQVEPGRARSRLSYVAVAALVLVYAETPLLPWALDLFTRRG